MIIDYSKVRKSSYNVIEVEDNIHIIENFIDQKDADFLVNFANSLSEHAWKEDMLYRAKQQAIVEFGTDDIDSLIKENKLHLNEYSIDKSLNLFLPKGMPTILDVESLNRGWSICCSLTNKTRSFISDEKKYEFSPFATMRRHYYTDGMPDHSDQKDMPQQRQSCVLYLNDDYLGGNLYFKYQEIEIKPKKYSLAIFNNGKDYTHGVKTVGDGPTRYTLASFISEIV
jgi:hypothetical protein